MCVCGPPSTETIGAMTYDTAIWKPANDLPDPTAEFDRRYDLGDSRNPNYRTPIPELVQQAGLLEAEFTGPSPWEDLRDSLDGDFLYMTMNYRRARQSRRSSLATPRRSASSSTARWRRTSSGLTAEHTGSPSVSSSAAISWCR